MRQLASLALVVLIAPLASRAAVAAEGTLTNCNGDTGSCTQTTCTRDYRGNETCTTITLRPPSPPTKQEARLLACEARERERQWEAHCRPEVYEDAGGMSRYRYARPNCDVAVLSGRGANAPWLTEPVQEKCRREAAER